MLEISNAAILVNALVGEVLGGLVNDLTKKLNVEPAETGLLENFKLAVTEFALIVQVAYKTAVPEPHRSGWLKLKFEGNVNYNLSPVNIGDLVVTVTL